MKPLGTHFTLFRTAVFAVSALLCASTAFATGPYAPAAGKTGTTAVHYDSAEFAGWASKVVKYSPGSDVESEWEEKSQCLGEADDSVYDITCLGNGGSIIMGFDSPIANGDGWDFAVFENGFGDGFLELAYVEVSSDGVNFVRFPNHSLNTTKYGAYATTVDPTNIDGLASKYRVGYGTPFDLEDLKDVSGVDKVDLNAITEIRIVDIVGDGSSKDTDGNSIYDPTPTMGSGGFDLNGIGVRHFADSGSDASATEIAMPAISVSGGKVVVSWTGKASATYRLQSSTDMKTWFTLEQAGGSAGTVSVTLSMPTVATFYRVVSM